MKKQRSLKEEWDWPPQQREYASVELIATRASTSKPKVALGRRIANAYFGFIILFYKVVLSIILSAILFATIWLTIKLLQRS